MMSGMLEGGLLSSAQRQAVTFSDSKIWLHAPRSANPQRKSEGICASNPTASAILYSSASLTSRFLRMSHNSVRQALSRLSPGTKYGVSDAERTFAGHASFALLLVWTNKNLWSGIISAYASAARDTLM